MDKTFTEVVSGIRHAEYGVEVREDIAQGMEYVKQHAEEVVSRQEEAVQSASAATAAAATATEQAEIAASTVEQATAGAVKSATDQADLAKISAEAAASSAEGAAASQTAAASSASAAKASEEAAAKSAADAKAIVSTDTTLTVSGAPADAKATGDALAQRYSKAEADAKFGTPYTLPPATADQLGGVKVGDYLDIAADGTLSAKTLNDKIAAAVAVKSEPRLVWNQTASTPNKWMSHSISIPDGVDYLALHAGASPEIQLARGGSTTYIYKIEGSTATYRLPLTFRADGTLIVKGPYSNSNYNGVVTFYLSGYHYPTLAELLTETQAAQADTDALAVDQEYRVALLELGLTDDTTTDTRTT